MFLEIPDLASRMEATSIARLQPPDDALLAGLLVKLFDDRQLSVKPAVIAFLLSRIDRSFASAHDLIDAIDRFALAQKREITRPFVAEVLEKTGIGKV